MRGFKALEEDLTNRYGFQYEVGKIYYLNGELKWKQNGFHFCKRPEDTLRYINAYNNYNIVEVEGFGEIVEYEDDYYGYYDMYASSILEIIRIVPREEIFDMIINSYEERVRRYIELTNLKKDEIDEIIKRYPRLMNTIDYYQNDEYILKRKRE